MFKCTRDPDIKTFLLKTAIPYEKAHKARTYLIIDSNSIDERDLKIIAYFSIALKCFKIGNGVSKSMKRKLNGIFQNDMIPCYLLGQIGKNDHYAESLKGKDIVDMAMNIIMDAHERVGGRFISVDCKDLDGLLRFYHENGFTALPDKDRLGFFQLIRFV